MEQGKELIGNIEDNRFPDKRQRYKLIKRLKGKVKIIFSPSSPMGDNKQSTR